MSNAASTAGKHGTRRRLADVERAAFEAGREAGFAEGVAATKLALVRELTASLDSDRAAAAQQRKEARNG